VRSRPPARAVDPEVVEWRRDFHQYPELGNREFRTSQKVAEQLRALGLEVKTGVGAHRCRGRPARRPPGPDHPRCAPT